MKKPNQTQGYMDAIKKTCVTKNPKEFPIDEKIVSMIVHDGIIFLATERSVYTLREDNTFRPIEIIDTTT